MILSKHLHVVHSLPLAIWLEKYLGLRFVLCAAGQRPALPWYVPVIELSAADCIWLMNVCADVGGPRARADLLFLRGVLLELLPPDTQPVTAP